MNISLNILRPIVNNNQWFILRTVKIIYFLSFSTFPQLGVYTVIASKIRPNSTIDTKPDLQLLPKGKGLYFRLSWVVVHTICTTPLSVNELVTSREYQGIETLGTIYLGFNPPTHSRYTHLARSVKWYFSPSTFPD